jgi:alkylation response protein AidB-like acyl-CoA dehydrogenase
VTAREEAVRALAGFFDADLVPVVRRMAYRPGHLSGGGEQDRAVRAMVWQGLVSLGIPDLPRSPGAGQETIAAVAEQLGGVPYQGPLLDTVTATELLVRTGGSDLLPPGASVAVAARGDATASLTEPAGMSIDPDAATVTARRDFVGFAEDVDHLLVVGRTPAGVRAALVPRDHPGVTVRRHEELGRGELYRVELAAVPVAGRLVDGDGWAAVLATARIRQAGYLVGLAQGALDLAVGYARRRHQFGQPIGRFQWIAFRLSALAAQIDAVRLLTRDAARQADRVDARSDVRFAAAQCLAAACELARSTTTEALQVHGAIGMTSDNDAQLYYRRVAVEALWLGSPTELRAEALPLLRKVTVAQDIVHEGQ